MRIIRNPKNNPYWIVITVFLLIFLMVGVLCLQYYKGLQSTIKNESHEYLQEISRQIAGNASRNIQDNFAVLGTISSVLKSSGVKTYEALQPEVLSGIIKIFCLLTATETLMTPTGTSSCSAATNTCAKP